MNNQIEQLYKRINKNPIEQRLIFARESKNELNINFKNLDMILRKRNINLNKKLNIMTFNMYYGRLINIDKNEIDIGIQVDKYECIFNNNLDIICLQEVVFDKLPISRIKEGNTTNSYIDRAKKISNDTKISGASVEYWKNWTNTFKEDDFSKSWNILKKIAEKYGFIPYPKEGGDVIPGSMYLQKFGNVIFYNQNNLQNKGFTINFKNSYHINKTIVQLNNFKETEDRSAIILCLQKINNQTKKSKSKSKKKPIDTSSNNDFLYIVNTHLSEKSNVFNKIQVQTKIIQSILKKLNSLDAKNIILCGDFNKPDNKTSYVLNGLLPKYNNQLLKKKHEKVVKTLQFYDTNGSQMYDLLRKNKYTIMENTFSTCWNARTVDQFAIKTNNSKHKININDNILNI